MTSEQEIYFAKMTADRAVSMAIEGAERTDHSGLLILRELHKKVVEVSDSNQKTIEDLFSFYMDVYLVNNQAKGGQNFISPNLFVQALLEVLCPTQRLELRVKQFTSFLSHVNSNPEGQLGKILTLFKQWVTKPLLLIWNNEGDAELDHEIAKAVKDVYAKFKNRNAA